ncbi:unnamed protein product [Cryptosporidium hominis]|uniref:Uncharacterized protein n=1 Tax=Cryptosporidium hominis TaxID=237895 RepID=A0A0S4TDQ5_CRYHO|nr:hypothetical protein [Cryptosporidium hominis TU502]OLQ19216.1 hypothetical protein ChTU502y2012_420g0145 [Cryptosporidium hominis]PPA62370.1 hypothetical protein ChUKH1_13700 [Cryptosporidium hominis]PPS96605.1 Uncharacterized protein GY17_00003470 [Cryptosporidium hominis]CUV04464.1 unnamed protein product [Cryptosporidium hominis]|eukprot:PPS96605.1 Uncharacterized protein GY17_00003470 [Cryptosporidium hominis]
MSCIQILDFLRNYINKWPDFNAKAFNFDNFSLNENSEKIYENLKKRVCGYLYDYLCEDEISEILYNSFKRLANTFITSFELEFTAQPELDITDLFVMFEIIDSEFMISDNTAEYCVLYRNAVSGKYEPNLIENESIRNFNSIASLIEHAISKFNSNNIYLLQDINSVSRETLEELVQNRYIRMYEIYKRKSEIMVNKIHLNQFGAETVMNIERSWEVILFSKIIGIIKTLFLVNNKMNDSEINNGTYEYSSAYEKSILLIAIKFTETLKIIQTYNKENNRCGTILFLQFELYEIIRNQFPYNLVGCIDDIEYWNYFQTYMEMFTDIQNLMTLELSYLPKDIEQMIDDAYFNRMQSIMDYMFNRIFIIINSIELKYYSSEKQEMNYLSSFCALIANYFNPLLFSKNESNEKYYLLIKASIEINIINWAKLSFLCTNHEFNTCDDSIKIETGSIVPKNISKVDFFEGKLINGYYMIFCGLKILYLLLNTTDISFFLPLVRHIFSNLQVVYCLLSKQEYQESLTFDYIDDFKRAKRLLDEIIILFSQSLNIEFIRTLSTSESNIDLQRNKTSIDLLNNLIENSCLIV